MKYRGLWVLMALSVGLFSVGCDEVSQISTACHKAYQSWQDQEACASYCKIDALPPEFAEKVNNIEVFREGCRESQIAYLAMDPKPAYKDIPEMCKRMPSKPQDWKVGCVVGASAESLRMGTLPERKSGDRETGNNR